MRHCAVHPGLRAAWHLPAITSREPARPGAGLVIEVPVKRLRQLQPLSGLQAKTVHIRDKKRHGDQALTAATDAEFSGLLDGEIRCIDREADLAERFST